MFQVTFNGETFKDLIAQMTAVLQLMQEADRAATPAKTKKRRTAARKSRTAR